MTLNLETLETRLTVGEIAGFINGALITLQSVLPLIFALVLLGIIQRGQHNPATWSSISNQLQGTLWPLLLRGDGSAADHVRWRVQLMAGIAPFATLCLTIAGFLTPIPLDEHQRPSQGEHNARFSYAPDAGFFGQGTLPRADTVHRLCGWTKWLDCPGTSYEDPAIRNKYSNHTVVNSSIPLASTRPFVDMSKDNTIASPMDIQYRNYYEEPNQYIDNGEVNVRGFIQPLQTILLDNQYRLVEGLIIDSISGGIGFRNHTVPLQMDLGAEWVEDILWLYPETVCTQTNLSLHFSVSKNYFYSTDNGCMTDDGGFANLDPGIPDPRFDGSDDNWQDAFGEAPDLQRRSYALAWWNNQLTARVLNVSSSSVGDRYTSEFANYAQLASPSSIKISEMDGSYLGSIYVQNASLNDFTSYGNDPCGSYQAYVNYPQVVAALASTILIPAIHQSHTYRYDLSSNWTQQLYTCASAMKALIQSVTFGSSSTNTSADLSVLHVLDVNSKNYSADSMPTWVIEKADGYQIQDISLLWGLANESQVDKNAFETRQAAELYLPAANHGITFGHIYDSFAAGTAPAAAWNSVYVFAASVRGAAMDFIPRYLFLLSIDCERAADILFSYSYSGESNYGLTLKYRDLSRTPEGAAKIMNLIWTDLMAFTVVGTKTGFEVPADPSVKSDTKFPKRSSSASTDSGQRRVHPMVRKIGYRDIRYAIPAFIISGILLTSLLTATLLALRKLLSYRILKHYINQTSMGRSITQIRYPTVATARASTKEWSRATRNIVLDVPRP
ncbi:MAG: hypothetical protein Q9218_001589 [Villophora microphyllina]